MERDIMEAGELKKTTIEDLPDAHLEWISETLEIFDRGVRKAQVENKRLGIVLGTTAVEYPKGASISEVSTLSESD